MPQVCESCHLPEDGLRVRNVAARPNGRLLCADCFQGEEAMAASNEFSLEPIYLCRQYSRQVARLYGELVARQITIKYTITGRYEIRLALDGYQLKTYTEEEIRRMIANLTARKAKLAE